MREILEKAAGATAERDAITQKIGDYYGSCIDDKAVDARGFEPLKPELQRIAKAKDKSALIEAVARVQPRWAQSPVQLFTHPPTCTMPTR